MRKLAASAVLGGLVGLVGVTVAWLTLSSPVVPAAQVEVVQAEQATDPVVVSRMPEAPEAAQADPKRGWRSRSLQRLERKELEVHTRLDRLTQSGELTEEEAQLLRKISARTQARVRSLVQRRQDGEIGLVGLVVRSMSVRIGHVTQVVESFGRERAREIGRAWEADRHQNRD